MKRHDRAYIRHQRKRWMVNRAGFWRRFYGEWTPRIAGQFAKSNGSCNCWMCAKTNKWCWGRPAWHRESRRLINEQLAI